MSSKTLIFSLVLAVALHGLSMQARSEAAGGEPVVVRIVNAMPASGLPNVSMTIRVVGQGFFPPVSLGGGQEFLLKASENSSYNAVAVFGLKFAAFYPYAPTRDKGQAAVNWKVDDVGFYKSYDETKWKLDTPWETD
ncbi:hypothetical protein F511_02832 [Dorcoceras hygrometricum]|uniref:Uncharacterized protein n=1 Tax=Dorcoceras hygrometricum TaxID=472368 RepID=A0A2Z7BL13_9LAMI|nr:hypothetical protein F511_02832 [Dorcoceras hygrometricum]